ncbi:hypothetical protein [Amnibacterium sp.]|uniref:hypothetical protein n=1 Tax=Amnibacterium sp. TaxID=1872496 RepID=UPI003F7CCF45
MADETGDERDLIRAVDEHLTEVSGVVVDDVVLRAWGNEQVDLTYLLLSAAITASGGEVDEADLWLVARAVAFAAPIAATRPEAHPAG